MQDFRSADSDSSYLGIERKDSAEPPHPQLRLGYQKLPAQGYTIRLEKALRRAARIVADYGEEYLPIFRRIEDELLDLRGKKGDLERARSIASEFR